MSLGDEAVVTRWWTEWWNQGDESLAYELHTAGCRDHDPASPWVAPGVEGMKQKLHVYRCAFPDLNFSVEKQFGVDDHVVSHWTAYGTHRGEVFGLAPTGRGIEVEGISIFRLENGRIAEHVAVWDTLGMMRQLGA